MPPGAVSVTRRGPFGNPFVIGEGAPFRFTNSGDFRATKSLRLIQDADQAVIFFRAWLYSPHGKAMRDLARQRLIGKNLACWCPLGQRCHADVLLDWANA